jgi:hypothetical protein
MLKTNLSGLICYEISAQIKLEFEVETKVVECGEYTILEPTEELTQNGELELKRYIRAFEKGYNSITSVLNEIQEHAELITTKINQI